MKRSTIGWTDYSGGALNFVRGCTPVSEGCENCYARAIYERFGKDFGTVTADEDALDKLVTLALEQDGNKRGPHSRPMAFVCDTGDLFHQDVPDEFIWDAFYVMSLRTDVTWQVLTKRAERMHDLLKGKQTPPPNVWLGVTCENQARADERIPILLDTPAAVRFVSVEPMLGKMDLWQYQGGERIPGPIFGDGISWVICGAESGPNRRPFDVAWASRLYDECRFAGVPFFGKQASGLRPGEPLVLPGVGVVQEWPKEGKQ